MTPPDPVRSSIEELRDELRLTREALSRMTSEGTSLLARLGESAPDTITLYGAGALLHGFYTATERLLQTAAREFNTEPSPGAGWHRALLLSASSERVGRRPEILSS